MMACTKAATSVALGTRRSHAKALFATALLAALSACVTQARLHTEAELSAVGRACGAAEGEVIQDAEEPRVLFFYAVAPPRAQIHCLAQWARRHHLHLAYIQAVEQKSQ